MSAGEYGQSVAHIVGMSESGHRSCKCGAVYDRSEHIAEVARKICSFECAVCAPPHAVRKRALLTQDQVRPFTARAEGEGEVSDRVLVLF
jgi:hypothetical protein